MIKYDQSCCDACAHEGEREPTVRQNSPSSRSQLYVHEIRLVFGYMALSPLIFSGGPITTSSAIRWCTRCGVVVELECGFDNLSLNALCGVSGQVTVTHRRPLQIDKCVLLPSR